MTLTSLTPRSLAVTIMAVAQLAHSSLSLVSGGILLLLITGQLHLFSADLTGLSLYFKGLVVTGTVISLVGLVGGIGLWRRRAWGWIAAIVFQGLCLLNNGLALLGGRPPSTGVYVSIGVFVGMLMLLCLPSVRRPCFNPISK